MGGFKYPSGLADAPIDGTSYGRLDGAWSAVMAVVTPVAETPTGAVNGINTDYETSLLPSSSANVIVTLDGVVQRNGIDYTVSGTTISFVVAPASGSEIFTYYNSVSMSGAMFAASVLTTDVDYQALASDGVIRVDAAAGAVTITLPTAASMPNRGLMIKKWDSTGHAMIVEGSGGDTIDGNLNVTTTVPKTSLTVVSDGLEWSIH